MRLSVVNPWRRAVFLVFLGQMVLVAAPVRGQAPSPGAPRAAAANERIFLLPASRSGGDADIEPSARGEAHAAIRAALESRRLEVVAPRRPHLPEGCAAPACLRPVLERLGAAAAVHMTLWGPTEDRAAQVVVSVIDRDHVYGGSALVRDDAIGEAAQTALGDALSRRVLGPGPWLSVRGTPLGARITVDGDERGGIPARLRVEAGLHQVVVESPGYATETQTVRVAGRVDSETVVEVELSRASVGAGPEVEVSQSGEGGGEPRSGREGGRAIVGPAVLLGLGVAAVVVGAVGLGLGESESFSDGEWYLEQPAGGAIAGWFIGGAVLVGAAALWFLLSGNDDGDAGQAWLETTPMGARVSW